MGYKTNITKEFKSKGFIDLDTFSIISSEKKDSGTSFDIREIFEKIGKNGDEVTFSLNVKDTSESIEEDVE